MSKFVILENVADERGESSIVTANWIKQRTSRGEDGEKVWFYRQERQGSY